jgi:hypothetical protein
MTNRNHPHLYSARVAEILRKDAEEAVHDHVTVIPSVHAVLNSATLQGKQPGADVATGSVYVGPVQKLSSQPHVYFKGTRSLLRFAGLGVVLALLITSLAFLSARTHTASAAEILRKASAASSFVPAGKIRHIVVTHSDDVSGSGGATTDEVWLANGRSHLLMWKPATVAPGGQSLPYGGAVLINDEAIWRFKPDGMSVTKLAFYDGALSMDAFLPNQAAVDKLLHDPQTTVLGADTLQGRDVVVIEGHVGSFVSGSPLEIALGRSKGYDTAQHDYKLWIDTRTYQIVQEQHYITWEGTGPTGHHKITDTKLITKDEVVDASSVSADLFTFKLPAGATLTDLTTAGQSQASSPTPQPRHTSWYEFTSEQGNFGVLMPMTPDQGSTTNSSLGHTEYLIGAKQAGYSYVVRYTDYPQDVVQKIGIEKWLDNERDYIVVSVPGKLVSERSITLNGYPGREIRVLADDGKFRICRLYLVNNRYYNVYVVMPDQNSVSAQVEKYLDSFRLLKP